jgi:hypothetical protein
MAIDIVNIFLLAFVFLILFIYIIQDFNQRLFAIIILILLVYLYYLKTLKSATTKDVNRNTFIDKIEKDLSVGLEIPENSIFFIHKTPTNLKYIKKTEELLQVLYEIKFLSIYNRELFYKLISYIEYFLKIHYKMMLGKYEFKIYYQILRDIRIEILNIMKGSYYSLPNISTILTIPDINAYMEKRIRTVQAVTYRYLKIICHKYKQPFKPPAEFDVAKDNHYALF